MPTKCECGEYHDVGHPAHTCHCGHPPHKGDCPAEPPCDCNGRVVGEVIFFQWELDDMRYRIQTYVYGRGNAAVQASEDPSPAESAGW